MIYTCKNDHVFNRKFDECPICGSPAVLTVEEMLECRIEQAIEAEEAKRPCEEPACDDLPDPVELPDGTMVNLPVNRKKAQREYRRLCRQLEGV